MRLAALALCAALVTGCALRPRYNDFVTARTEGKEATFVVVDTDTSRPVPGARVEVSEYKNRVIVTTGADGTFKLPVDKKYLEENPIFLVTLPKDVVHYRVELFQAPPPPAPKVDEAVDAGAPSNG
ncbi:MAG: hypothetical protein U0228_22290 [Myxococcaceae bacterium]